MGENMKIKDYKDYLRPYEKANINGIDKLNNEELLAILINCGTKNKNCLEISHDILNSLTDLSELLVITKEELEKFPGIGRKKAIMILSAIELVKRCESVVNETLQIQDKETVYKLLRPKISGLKTEKLFVFFLNVKLRLIRLKEYENFDVSSVQIPIRDIVKEAVLNAASFIIISHNHPSMDVTPSKNDIKSTLELYEALSIMNIELLDHVIVSTDGAYSLKENLDF